MKNLLFSSFLFLMIFSCHTSYETEGEVGNFSNYYEQFQKQEGKEEFHSQKLENDSLQPNSKELVNN